MRDGVWGLDYDIASANLGCLPHAHSLVVIVLYIESNYMLCRAGWGKPLHSSVSLVASEARFLLELYQGCVASNFTENLALAYKKGTKPFSHTVYFKHGFPGHQQRTKHCMATVSAACWKSIFVSALPWRSHPILAVWFTLLISINVSSYLIYVESTLKVAPNEVGKGCTNGHLNHIKDIYEVQDIQPCPINYVCYRGVAARAGSVHLMCYNDQ